MKSSGIIEATSGRSAPTLLTLPKELQDIILDFVHDRQDDKNTTSRKDWEDRECIKQHDSGEDYVKRSFEDHKVNEFLVSKEFFVAASQAWARNQIFAERKLLCIGRSSHRIIGAFAQKVKLRSTQLELIQHFPNMLQLTVEVSVDLFRNLDSEIVVEKDELSKEHFDQLLEHEKHLGELRGLEILRLEADCRVFSYGFNGSETYEAAKAVWTKNVANLEAYLRPRATESKAESPADATCTQADELYHGSAVRSSTNELPEVRVRSSAYEKYGTTDSLHLHETLVAEQLGPRKASLLHRKRAHRRS